MGNQVGGRGGEELDRDGGWFVLQLLALENVPTIAQPSALDRSRRVDAIPFVVAYLSVAGGAEGGVDSFVRGSRSLSRVSPKARTLPRNSVGGGAVFNAFRNLGMSAPSGAFLSIEVYHSSHGLHHHGAEGDSCKLLGWVDIKIDKDLSSEGQVTSLDLNCCEDCGPMPETGQFSISLRRLFVTVAPPRHKVFFLVRHGESAWNKAQLELDIGGMLLDRDHPLTVFGVEQGRGTHVRWNQFRETGHYTADDLRQDGENGAGGAMGTEVSGQNGQGMNLESRRRRSTLGRARLAMQASNKSARLMAGSVFAAVRRYSSAAVSLADAGVAAKAGAEDCHTVRFDQLPEGDEAEEAEEEQDGVVAVKEELADGGREAVEEEATGEDDDDDDEDDDDVSPDALLHVMPRPAPEEQEAEAESDRGPSSAPPPPPPQTLSTDSTATASTEGSQSDEMSEQEVAARRLRGSRMLRRLRQSAPSLMVLEQRVQYMRQFLAADAVFCSPLTRAVETALVVLESHAALVSRGLTLCSCIREVKGLGGMDSVGLEVGRGILERVQRELEVKLGAERAAELLVPLNREHSAAAEPLASSAGFDANDCEAMWWTPMHSFESAADQHERMLDFLAVVRYSDSETPVFVGHSLFFKLFYSTRLSKMLDKNRPLLTEKLQRFRLSNATVLAVTVVFPDDGEGGAQSLDEAVILDADVLFGGGFHDGAHQAHEHLRDEEGLPEAAARDVSSSQTQSQAQTLAPASSSPSQAKSAQQRSLGESIRVFGKGIGDRVAAVPLPSFLRRAANSAHTNTNSNTNTSAGSK